MSAAARVHRLVRNIEPTEPARRAVTPIQDTDAHQSQSEPWTDMSAPSDDNAQ